MYHYHYHYYHHYHHQKVKHIKLIKTSNEYNYSICFSLLCKNIQLLFLIMNTTTTNAFTNKKRSSIIIISIFSFSIVADKSLSNILPLPKDLIQILHDIKSLLKFDRYKSGN